MQIIVIGGSAAGLSAALMLARGGHGVTVLERDDLRPAPDVETAAATAFRAAAPQIVQPHVLLSTCRLVLKHRLPDVYSELLTAGAVEASLTSQMPATLTDRSAAPGDDELVPLMTRRATLDWVLGRAACTEPGVEIRHGLRVIGLVAEPGDPPRVRGVRTETGEVLGDLIVDATGRRSALDRWLIAVGARPSATSYAECGSRLLQPPIPATRCRAARAGDDPPDRQLGGIHSRHLGRRQRHHADRARASGRRPSLRRRPRP